MYARRNNPQRIQQRKRREKKPRPKRSGRLRGRSPTGAGASTLTRSDPHKGPNRLYYS